ncbi:hypothetical protein HDU84_005097 [Entophlyctis sp. JEL0112]|nr:hypothetical protein HDU84_005097 [Entophlyctis sp. JEL0112]
MLRRAFSTAKDSIAPASLPMPCVVIPPHPAALERHALHGAVAESTLRPAVVVLQEWWGINETIRAHAQRVANGTGAIAVVPDLYNGKSTADEEEAKHLMDNLDWPDALGKLSNLALQLQRPQDDDLRIYKNRKVGTLGFCMGGALSLAVAARMAELKSPLNACVAFYGTPPKSLIDISKIPATTPVQAHFGEKDSYLGFSDVKTAHRLAKTWDLTVKQLGGIHAHGIHSLESNVFVHSGMEHAFMNESAGKHVFGGEVDKAWEKVFAFLTEHLKTV